MTRLTCIVQSGQVRQIRDALCTLHVAGMMVSAVRDAGRPKAGIAGRLGGMGGVSPRPRMMIEVVVENRRAEEIAQRIIAAARAGDHGNDRALVALVPDGAGR